MTRSMLYTLINDGKPDVHISGWQLASVSNYPGRQGRWVELRLYRTDTGELVCQKNRRNCDQDGSDTHTERVVDDKWGVIEFFGHSALARKLYRVATISPIDAA